ncbi:hypothetical protein HZH66_013260 [Vespula vulgaris]|uniref:Uncharacterized protein n=1 Tax=Vespula vulgaris TaxID=7454 RepID=A0A834J6I9_VESVU|nr:hypothetical protein HZH66_013260 [Vespula vulgaris]
MCSTFVQSETEDAPTWSNPDRRMPLCHAHSVVREEKDGTLMSEGSIKLEVGRSTTNGKTLRDEDNDWRVHGPKLHSEE